MLLGFQGIEGSNCHHAALLMAERSPCSDVKLLPMGGADSVVSALLMGRIHCGVMAFSTDAAGAVAETKRACEGLALTVLDHCHLPIAHHLFVRADFMIGERPAVISSHPEALRECKGKILERFPLATLLAANDTATAAQQLAQGLLPLQAAVLCTKKAGERFGLQLFEAEMQDLPFNGTDFLLVKIEQKA